MNWKIICEHLYSNIKPTKGILHSYVNNQYHGKPFIDFYIEYDMNEFIYEDPFYGQQSSNSMFKTNFELMEITKRNLITDISELNNLVILFNEKRKFGSYSNSLHLVPHQINFNDLSMDSVNCEIEYSITNSDSYGMMNGTFEEHMKLTGTIKSELELAKLTIISKSELELEKLINSLNEDVYDIRSIEIFQESERSNSYKVGYKKEMNKLILEQRTISIKKDER